MAINPNVVELKRLLYGGKPSELSSYMVSPPDAFQDKMNCLFVALFNGVNSGFGIRVVEQKHTILSAAAGHHNFTKQNMAILRAIEFFCQTASIYAVREVPYILMMFYDSCLLEKYQIRAWYLEGSTGASKDNPIWEACKSYIENLHRVWPNTDDEFVVSENEAEDAY